MAVSMVVGMMLLDPVWDAVLGRAGLSNPTHPDLGALITAIDMTVAMTVWILYRGHGRAAVVEMAAATSHPVSPADRASPAGHPFRRAVIEMASSNADLHRLSELSRRDEDGQPFNTRRPRMSSLPHNGRIIVNEKSPETALGPESANREYRAQKKLPWRSDLELGLQGAELVAGQRQVGLAFVQG
jgi:hypothetical protein